MYYDKDWFKNFAIKNNLKFLIKMYLGMEMHSGGLIFILRNLRQKYNKFYGYI